MSEDVAVGRFGSPFGVKGWLKVFSYTNPKEKILQYLPWYIIKDQTRQVIQDVKGKLHGQHVVVQLMNCEDRELAKTFTNLEIYIERKQLPQLSNEEYYWIDLIGLTVINQDAICLGTVENIFATGSNDVLVVREKSGKERYVPYIEGTILQVDLDNKKLAVDWDADF